MSELHKYHHGDLHQALLLNATAMIEQQGIESLSLRKLAEKVGVSRTAPYHHFKDKNALLSAVAAEGFQKWQRIVEPIFENQALPLSLRFRHFIRAYIDFACENPQVYDLMFGRVLWQQHQATDTLREAAYPCFQYQRKMADSWQKNGLLPSEPQALRLAQVTWSTLHGMAKLIIDGIYADASHLDEMCECAAMLFMQRSGENIS